MLRTERERLASARRLAGATYVAYMTNIDIRTHGARSAGHQPLPGVPQRACCLAGLVVPCDSHVDADGLPRSLIMIVGAEICSPNACRLRSIRTTPSTCRLHRTTASRALGLRLCSVLSRGTRRRQPGTPSRGCRLAPLFDGLRPSSSSSRRCAPSPLLPHTTRVPLAQRIRRRAPLAGASFRSTVAPSPARPPPARTRLI